MNKYAIIVENYWHNKIQFYEYEANRMKRVESAWKHVSDNEPTKEYAIGELSIDKFNELRDKYENSSILYQHAPLRKY